MTNNLDLIGENTCEYGHFSSKIIFDFVTYVKQAPATLL